MTNAGTSRRTDSASRVIGASRHAIYQAFMDPNALVEWLPPRGMKAQLLSFDPREGGGYRMALIYQNTDHPAQGKTSEHTDVVQVKFVELVPSERIVQVVEFESDNPAFAGEMKMTWSFAVVPDGTRVTVLCENVPEGISKEDHDAGLSSTLENLAAFMERESGTTAR
jgi:uncharacterized protein YndB with AHSA1/START domain